MVGMQHLDLSGTKITDLGPIADLIRGGLDVDGVDDDGLNTVRDATGGDPLAGDPLSRAKDRSAQRLEVFFQL